MQREALTEQLAHTAERLRYGADKAMACLGLLRDPAELYRRADDGARRDLLGALFAKLIVYVEDDMINVESERSATNESVLAISEHARPDTAHDANIPRSQTGIEENKNRGPSSTRRG